MLVRFNSFPKVFITDRDSITKTLGKRMDHKKIVGDLHTWLDAKSERDGLNEIENRIDPTDFEGLNIYDANLQKFYDFMLETDHLSWKSNLSPYYNPWVVVVSPATLMVI